MDSGPLLDTLVLETLDETHDPARRSWVREANGHAEFPIQNLPLGVFQHGDDEPGGGIAIGDHILSLRALGQSGLLAGDALTACNAGATSSLNDLLSMGSGPRRALRRAVSALLAEGAEERRELLRASSACQMMLPTRIGDYTDFYAGIVHARNVGELFRPDHPLLPNYKWVPIGYHGRSSSVRVSGEDVRRPCGQRMETGATAPTFAPTSKLDFELELAIWLGGGNTLGEPIAIDRAHDSIVGYGLLNDWSARDVQTWEYQPLGPFLAKSFHTTVSPWIVTPEALAPFRQAQTPRLADDPAPLAYLLAKQDQSHGALSVALEVWLRTARMRELDWPAERITQADAADLYWTPAQLVAHHTSNGCNLRPGDLFGTGTISSPGAGGTGSLLEHTRGGSHPLTLACGETRTFLDDGDEITLRAHAHRDGWVSIGFGECTATVLPARTI
jgi:fumarylacetoacetase